MRQTRKQFPNIRTQANRSCNRNEVFVKGFSADQKRELVRELRGKYRGVRITRDARGEYIVYDDETRNIRSTYLSPEHLVPNARLQKLRITKKTAGKVEDSVRKFNVMGSAKQLDFSQIYNAPRITISKKKASLIPKINHTSLNHITDPDEEKLNRFIDKLYSANHEAGNEDEIFGEDFQELDADKIATLMIDRFNRRKKQLDEITSSNQLSMDQFLKQNLFKDHEPLDQQPQTIQPQAQQPQAQQPQVQQPQVQQHQAQETQTKNSHDIFVEDVKKTKRQIIFKDLLSESIFRDSQSLSRISSISEGNQVNHSQQIEPQNISEIFARSSQNISQVYLGSLPQNSLTSYSLDKDKFKIFFLNSFARYNQIISQSSSESLEQDPSVENSSNERSARGESLKLFLFTSNLSTSYSFSSLIKKEDRRDDGNDSNTRSGSPGAQRRNRLGTSKALANLGGKESSNTICGSAVGFKLNFVSGNIIKGQKEDEDSDSVGEGPSEIHSPPNSKASSERYKVVPGRGVSSSPRNNKDLTTRPGRGPGLDLRTAPDDPASISNSGSDSAGSDSFRSNISDNDSQKFDDADEKLKSFIEAHILNISVHDGVSKSLNQSQDSSQIESQQDSILRELREINQAKIVGLMKQRFSEFKASYQIQHHQDSSKKIDPELYKRFLFETDDQGRPARSNATITVPVICKALAILLGESENIPNEIVKSPQSTESSPQSPKSNDSSIISYRSDYGGNVMNEILKILNDQEGLNLGSESFENADHENSFNQGQEGKKVNRENFVHLVQMLFDDISLVESSQRKIEVDNEGNDQIIKLDADIFPILRPQEILDTLALEGHNNESASDDHLETPPSTPSGKKESPGLKVANMNKIVKRVLREGSGTPRNNELKVDSSRIKKPPGKLSPETLARFEETNLKNTSSKISHTQLTRAPFTVNTFPPSLAFEGVNQELKKASPAFTASTLDAVSSPATSGYSHQTTSSKELSFDVTSNSGSLNSSPASAGLQASDSEIASRSSSPASIASAGGSEGWIVKKAQAVQSLFEYSIIHQDEQEEQNPKKNYDFFIQKSPDHDSQDSNNEKTKIAILKAKFKKIDDEQALPMPNENKEKEAREFVKKAIIKAIEKTKISYPNDPQNSSSQDYQIYYDYLEIAIAVEGVNNKEQEFKEKLREKGIAESEIEDNFENAKLLSANFQQIAKDDFEIYTGRIGEERSKIVGMRTKRIPLDLLKEVQQKYCQKPSASPSDPDDWPLTGDLMFQSQRSNP
jgi:hypothetical protein